MTQGANLIQTSMRGGEVSRAVRARHDLPIYADALEVCQNAIVRAAGPADKRGGFVDLGAPRASTGKAKWLVFRKSTRDVVRIELCNGKLRFREGFSRSYILAGADPIELDCPWNEVDWPGLRTWQSGDVLWISHVSGTYPLMRLKRTAPNTFVLDEYEFEEGPFLPRAKGITLTFTAVSGTGVTCTASGGSPFTANMIGALIRVEAINYDGMLTWAFDNSWLMDEIARHGNNIYKVVQRGSQNKSGDAPPVHTRNSAWDGSGEKIRWEFQGFTHGLARITAISDPTQVTVEILQRLPFYGSTAKESDVWQFGAFCDEHGYPRAGTIHEERLVVGGNLAEVDTVFGSRSAGYDADAANGFPGFLGNTVDDDAFRRSIANGEVNPVVWMLALDALIVGTEGGVWRIAPPSPDEPITPAGATGRQLCAIPCSVNVPPVTTPTSFIYVPLHETELIEVQRKDQIEPRNLAELAEHMIAGRVRSMAFTRKPSNVLWILDEEGFLSSLTYSPENDVFAWSRHVLGGGLSGEPAEIDDISAAPGPYGTEELWAFTRRTINGSTVRRVEYMERTFNPRRMRIEDACCLDAAGYFDQWNADAAKTMTFAPSAPGSATGALTSAGHTPFVSGDVGKTIFLRKVKATPRATDSRGPVRLMVTAFTNSSTVSVVTVGEFSGLFAGEAIVQWAFAVTTLSGLSRLEGQRVRVNADGGDYGSDLSPLTVTSGAITLPEPVARGWVGLPYRTHLRSLPLNMGEASGSARGALQRIDRAFVMIDGAAAGVVQRVGTTEAGVAVTGRLASDFVGQTPPAATDDAWEEVPGGFSRGAQLEFINDTALPSNIAGWVMRVTTHA
jgi:hypothetical protein